MSLCKTLIHQISHQLNVSCKCIHQTTLKFDKFHTITTKSGTDRTPKVSERQKRLIKLPQVRNRGVSRTGEPPSLQGKRLSHCAAMMNENS